MAEEEEEEEEEDDDEKDEHALKQVTESENQVRKRGR